MAISPLQQTLLTLFAQESGWITRTEIGERITRKKELNADDIAKLEGLHQEGHIAKRIQPSTTDSVVFEYHALKSRRTRREVVYNILKENFHGTERSRSEVAVALGHEDGRLSTSDAKHLHELVAQNLISESVAGAKQEKHYKAV
ncbi:MAG: hypothetical protein SGJ24_01175 [Chloroflexota bacterium]|nr:hypothetical protein [Chloroflexota bacterium]